MRAGYQARARGRAHGRDDELDCQHDEEVETVVQPDLVVVCDKTKLDQRGCRGAPELVVEILSPSTAARDHVTKRALYDRHGVREYWLVHPLDRILMVYRRGESGRFEAAEPVAAAGKLVSAGPRAGKLARA